MSHTLEGVQLLDACLLLRSVTMTYSNVHAVSKGSAVYASHGNTACIVAVVERCDEHLRCSLYLPWGWYDLYNLVKQIVDVVGRLVPLLCHPSVLCRTIDNGEVELVLSSVEREHKVEHHLVDLLGTAIGLVNLVDYHDGLQSELQSFLQYEARLRHRPLKGIDEQQTTIGHIEHTLNLTTKVGVTRGVEDVYLYSFPVYGYVFRKNGNATLAFQIVGIEHFSTVILSVAEKLSCEHHLVDESCLAMVDVSNNCYVPNVLHCIK